MKRSSILLGCFLCTSASFAAPIFYGKMNFDARYIDQNVSDRREEVVAASLKNLPPRLGMHGSIKPDELALNVLYFGEFGYHTWSNSGGGEVKLRMAGVTLDGDVWGKLTIGRHYSPTELIGAEIDPLMNTSASGVGLDQYFDISGARTFNGIGYYSRYFQDAISYKTSSWKGLQFALTVDSNSRSENSKVKVVSDTQYSATYYSAFASYEFELSEFKNKFYLGMVKGSGLSYNFAHSSSSPYPIEIDRDQRWQVAFKSTYRALTFATHYGEQEVVSHSDHSVKPSNRLGFVALSYNGPRHLVGLTYSEAKYNDDNGKSDVTQSQLALGYQYHLTKGADLTLTLAHYDADGGNKAKMAMVGSALNF